MTLVAPLGLSRWESACAAEKASARAHITAAIEQDTASLVSVFYNVFLHHEVSAAFLSHSVVQERLSGALRSWLLGLVDIDPLDRSAEFEQLQLRIGEVHARINIPNHLVMAGATLLKTEISRRIMANCADAASLGKSLILLNELMDHAVRIMSSAYDTNARENIKENEAYRYLALGEDVDLERESQRAALMEWSQGVLFSLLADAAYSARDTLSASPFGLWVRHRARHLFAGSDLLKQIETSMLAIDAKLLPAIGEAAGGPDLPQLITKLKAQVEEIKFLLGTLFQAAASVENGRDPLTRTLNRRFLPALLGREISLANTNNVPLSLLMVDVDHFKQFNDTYGHTAGDTVLKLVAETILESVRSSDFVFRYGGEEFLILLVETPKERAFIIAERLRQKVESRPMLLGDATQAAVSVTVSVGLAAHEGHPDPQYLIDRADKALYRAKNSGRNKVISA